MAPIPSKTASTVPGKRSEVVSVRLAPKLRYTADIAARSQRRTISSLIEVAVAKYVVDLDVEIPGEGRPLKILEFVESLWDPDEADRFVLLAERGRWLLDIEEEHRWKAVRECVGAKSHLTVEQKQRLRPIYKELKDQVRLALERESNLSLSKPNEVKRGKELF